MGLCCVECFGDSFIKGYILDMGQAGDCDYCGSKGVAIAGTRHVGGFIRDGLSRAYEPLCENGIRKSLAADRRLHEAFTVREAFEEEGIFSEWVVERGGDGRLYEDLVRDSGDERCDIPDLLEGGHATLILRDQFNVETGTGATVFDFSWREFKDYVKHYARFFDVGGTRRTAGGKTGDGKREGLKTGRDQILEPISELLKRLSLTLPRGQAVFRATKARDIPYAPDTKDRRVRAVGPAPVSRSSHNRMSPPGISYMNCSSEPDTCISEIRPAVGERVYLGKFVVRKNLSIIDLSAMRRIKQSVFDPGYYHPARWASDFLDKFRMEISRPLLPDDSPVQYIPTQVFAEFVRERGYAGIKYRSSQLRSGHNFTMFCGPRASDYPLEGQKGERRGAGILEPFTRWLRLEAIQTVEITGIQFEYRLLCE